MKSRTKISVVLSVVFAGSLLFSYSWINAQDTIYPLESGPQTDFFDLKNTPFDFRPSFDRKVPFDKPSRDGSRQSFSDPQMSLDVKTLTKVPEPEVKRYIDSGDLRDPFLLLPGHLGDGRKVLQPGTTVDGIRFNEYSRSDQFLEQKYRLSNFSMEDVFGQVIIVDKGERCLRCHFGIEEISENHRFRCTQCHAGNGKTVSFVKAHKGLISNPSDLKHASKYCGKCHADHIEKVKRSLMATSKGEINLTRHAWGAQTIDSQSYSLFPQEGELAYPPKVSPGQIPEPVDDLLSKKCLRCHLQAPAPHRPGDYRGTGCAACHMVYTNDGLTMTRDRAIQSVQKKRLRNEKKRFGLNFSSKSLKNKRGYPSLHKFTLSIPSVQCEHCHHLNGPGNEFEGRLEKPSRPKPSRLEIDGQRPVLYGAQHEFLIPDIHRERGMHCIDCHNGEELKSGEKSPGFLIDSVLVRCEDCHGTVSKAPGEILLLESHPKSKKVMKTVSLNVNLRRKLKFGDVILSDLQGKPVPHIKKENGTWVLISKVTGKKHKIPILKGESGVSAHRLKAHMERVECSACHARWSANDWGHRFIYEEEPRISDWKDWGFSDPVLQVLLRQTGESSPEQGGSLSNSFDWLSAIESHDKINGQWKKGIWWDVVTETDWNSMILGKNHRGKYSILKPRFQFLVSKPDVFSEMSHATVPLTKEGKPGLVMVPYSPHTIRKTARGCESCHYNSLVLGLGDPKRERLDDSLGFLARLQTQNKLPEKFQLKQMIALDGQPLQTPFRKEGIRFLNQEEILGLSQKSDQYRAYRYFSIRERGFPRLLTREEFPFDKNHEQKKEFYGEHAHDEEDFYDQETREFVNPGYVFPSGTEPELDPKSDIIPSLEEGVIVP